MRRRWNNVQLRDDGVVKCENGNVGNIVLTLAPRDAVKKLLSDDKWEKAQKGEQGKQGPQGTQGVYVLLARNGDRFYARPGMGDVATRLTSHVDNKANLTWWTHAVLVRSARKDYSSSYAGFLEGLLFAACDNASNVVRVGKPDYNGSNSDEDEDELLEHSHEIEACMTLLGFPFRDETSQEREDIDEPAAPDVAKLSPVDSAFELLTAGSESMRKLHDDLGERAERIDASIERRAAQRFYGYYTRNRPIFSARPQKDNVLVYLKLDPKATPLTGCMRNMRYPKKIGHSGIGDVEYSLTSDDQLPDLLRLIRLAYKRVSA